MELTLRPLSFGLGAEAQGVDIAAGMTEGQFGAIYHAFLEYGVLLLRGQRISREQHIEFSRRFGELDKHDSVPRDRVPEFPELLLLTNEPNPDGTRSYSKDAGRLWHSDLSFTLAPAMGSVLRGIAIPPVGGDTMFSNMYKAYDALSAGMKKLIAELHGIHQPVNHLKKQQTPEQTAQWERANPPIAQPIVRVHPETGRKTLYIGEKISRFDGMTAAESEPIIQYLCRHAVQPEFTYRHCWQQDDILIWDNRCTIHAALGDYDKSKRRHMERTTVLGTPLGYKVSAKTTPA